MDTSKTEAKKYTLNSDDMGYGPKGEHSLSEWRKECLQNLNAGKDVFQAWQNSWSSQIKEDLPNKNFNLTRKLDFSNTDTGFIVYKPYTFDFSKQVFSEDIDLSEYEFNQIVFFVGASFEKDAIFKNCIFKEDVNFDYANFGQSVNFSKSNFQNISFSNTKFICHHVSFDDVVFSKYINFKSIAFPGQATSYNNVSFKRVIFISGVTFQGRSIGCNVDFTDAIFNEEANFENTIFNEQCTFKKAKFLSESNIRFKSKYNHLGANFASAEFKLDTDFSDCIFNTPTNFINTKFDGDVEFNNACFNDDVRFFKTEFLGGAFFNSASFTGNAVKRLSQMKRMAEENGQTDQALNFNALELDAKVKQTDASKIFILFTWLYKNVADYGRSFTLPLFWYGVLIWFSFLFAMGYAFHIAPILEENKHDLCKKAQSVELPVFRAASEYAMFRAGGLMDFTDTGKQNNSVNCAIFGKPIEPDEMRAWGIFKGIASIALLFLAALGLRNKYRIK